MTMPTTAQSITPREALLRQMLKFALNEIHNPGAYRYGVGGDITEEIEKLLGERFVRVSAQVSA